ncbi:carbamoyl-phosphate synthase large subunit [Desulfurobacterium pacificum]|uniref:Carbamoyl-phosphate synthase large subunit n=1 Tax=Desulfurobacterium pacificum TaxID=240166 RepID=A0ABY1NA98_9BACT|nr:ATP-grasp domain-containing protein [Desulfurobacterium pacificum]SMP04232.1 carbamoyl-phosphate synthase large subunit [Desulfurobacterium pacificum]
MYRVGVSGINAVDNPGPGIGIAKSVKESGLEVKVIGFAYDAMEPGIYMDWLIDKSYIMPYPSEGEEIFIERLLYIKSKSGLDAVIPALDAELPLFIKNAQKLSSFGIATFLPTEEQFRLRSKDKLTEVAEKIEVKVPKTLVVTSYEDFVKAVEEVGFPVMVKGIFYKAYKAFNISQATSYFNSIASEWGYPIIVQEVVSGEEMNVVGVGDGEGGDFGLVAIKKLWITSLGKIWTGVTLKNEKLTAAAKRFVEAFKWRGAFEFECIVNGDDIYLIEINPRFPAWVYFATGVGVNLPGRLLKASLGIEPERDSDYEAGKLYVRFTDDFVTDMEKFQKIVTRGEV